MTIVFKPSENIKKMMIKHYQNYAKDEAPQYTIFQAPLLDVVVTLYESGKVMFQGEGADNESAIWLEQERHLNNRIINVDDKKKTNQEPTKTFYNISSIGSDEVGTGDYFGPIVVTATYVNKENIPLLKDLGVKDSKKITDADIKKIAPELIKKIPYVTYILDNKTYNLLNKENQNMNKIKAILHNKVLIGILKKDNYEYDKIVIDQFVYPKKFYEYISNASEKINGVTFITKAEDQVTSVGAASIIARYVFLKEMAKMSNDLGMTIPLGAGSNVDEAAKEIIKKYGQDKLKEIAKLNFKNTSRIILK
jgi:ribonuclease HIII